MGRGAEGMGIGWSREAFKHNAVKVSEMCPLFSMLQHHRAGASKTATSGRTDV